MSPIDTYRDAFLELMRKGATPLEAYESFDETDFRVAMNEEIMTGDLSLNRETHTLETWDGLPSLLDLAAKAGQERRNLEDFEQAIELMGAGWTSEQPNGTACKVMSLYWRAPSKRPPKPGRRYLSTQQAFNAMKKAHQCPTT